MERLSTSEIVMLAASYSEAWARYDSRSPTHADAGSPAHLAQPRTTALHMAGRGRPGQGKRASLTAASRCVPSSIFWQKPARTGLLVALSRCPCVLR